ncbi:hypothetical protein PoB_006923800 [Plakobranchus ocellatus]|uniref:Secreted protein n=1 Tax=Plakobranchus ocellatus TaxID=259542 RepID=A0AAV4DET1_9GAST|nr:hypothetical protein PoB_006923800 [Plakobranchus ocellatus]
MSPSGHVFAFCVVKASAVSWVHQSTPLRFHGGAASVKSFCPVRVAPLENHTRRHVYLEGVMEEVSRGARCEVKRPYLKGTARRHSAYRL